MKHFKRSNTYKASNVSYNVDDKAAYSYNWWLFTKEYKGLMIFNNHNYSPTTNRHQSKVRTLMSTLNHKIDLMLDTRLNLTNIEDAITDHIECKKSEIQALIKKIHTKGTRKAKNKERRSQIFELIANVRHVQSVLNK